MAIPLFFFYLKKKWGKCENRVNYLSTNLQRKFCPKEQRPEIELKSQFLQIVLF